jgi:S1-C subfamily serine protease
MAIVIGLFGLILATPADCASPSRLGRSVVKIYVTLQRENYATPWRANRPTKGTGSGFILRGKRILTNAHIVSDKRFLEVQKNNDAKRYVARVEFVGHDCDLAILRVDDPAFFKGTAPLRFARSIPHLNDEVTVLGYPMGGNRMSLTKGVVSRVDYSRYSHSGLDEHLVLQVDAAINPGNSGGPVTFRGRVVGLAFQGIQWADNIGYAIPLPVIRRFMDDVEDGEYHGYPELGVAHFASRNPAIRQSLGLTDAMTGPVVYRIDPFGSAAGILKPGDVLMGIDGHTIADDGTIAVDGTRVVYAELLERKQWGDAIEINVWRERAAETIRVPLRNPPDPFLYRNVYDQRARYVMIGGLVFSPLSRPYMNTLSRSRSDANTRQLRYLSEYAKVDGPYLTRDEFVVLIRRLPHPVNSYATGFENAVLSDVNGVHIRKLEDVRNALLDATNGYYVFRFMGMDEELVLDKAIVDASQAELLNRYSIAAPSYFSGEK